ncbi:MAG: phospho-sugar mutase, partial [Actinomycetota bacterium]|nr:phospho-sugar mutase [Actinomycetota bacterium]
IALGRHWLAGDSRSGGHPFEELGAHAVPQLGAAAGLMITASHNPATDNGMKVYWSDGAQIVAPLDAAIEARIAVGEVPPAGDPSPTTIDLGSVASGGPTIDAYVHAVATTRRPLRPPRPLRTVYTALHGVGAELFERVTTAAGVVSDAVASQRDPDPDFPTVTSPNPEEAGTLDELFAEANRRDADLAIALDPDADRLALGVPTDQGWRQLNGDETGALLAHHLLDLTDGTADRFVASTVVSSRLVARMCAASGVRHVETLTGFKWLSRPGLAHPAWHQVLLYEEALGYAVGPHDRDKDGIAAACCAVDAVGTLRDQGLSVVDLLDDLARRHGAFVTRNGSVRLVPGTPAADPVVPASLGGVPVVRDDRPVPDVHRWLLEDDTRVIVRPSGTEPKLKYYCEAVVPVGDGDVSTARATAAERLDAVLEELRSILGT